MLYFFVARKSEAELCRDFIEEMTSKLQLPILGEVTRFADIFKYLLQLSKIRPITLIIDEFQDFKRVNPSIFSDMQKIWDLNKQEAHINLVVCGSVYSLMNIIFKNNKQLFELADADDFRYPDYRGMGKYEFMKDADGVHGALGRGVTTAHTEAVLYAGEFANELFKIRYRCRKSPVASPWNHTL